MSRSTDFVVLVAEDEAPIRRGYVEALDRLPNVVALPAADKDEAIEAIHSHYIDAAVVDIEMPKGVATGFDVLDELAVRAPNASVVIATKVTLARRQRLMALVNRKAPHILAIIDKKSEDSSMVIRPIKEAVAAWEQTAILVTGEDLLEELLWTPARRKRIELRDDRGELTRELDRVYRDLFGSIRGVEEDDRSARVTFEKLDREGLSPAVTALAAVTLGTDRRGRTVQGNLCVVKVGPRLEIQEEAARYERVVKFGVRLAQRVEMLSTSLQDHLGGICYSFAGGVFGSSLKTIDEILRTDGGARLAEAAFSRLFDPDNGNWYGVACGELSPRKYMQNAYHTNFDRCYDVLHGSLRKAAAKVPAKQLTFEAAEENSDGYLRFQDGRLDIPSKEFLGSQAIFINRPACLVHGDMHGGNVMVELDELHVGYSEQELKRVCLIDYRNAGPAPRPLDVLALQASVRLADAHAIARDASPNPSGDELAALLRIAAQRVHAEGQILEETWKGDQAHPHQTPPAVRPAWERTTRTLTELMRANFKDMQCDEYLASALPCALRQCSFDIGVVARVRMLAWVSAMYAELTS